MASLLILLRGGKPKDFYARKGGLKIRVTHLGESLTKTKLTTRRLDRIQSVSRDSNFPFMHLVKNTPWIDQWVRTAHAIRTWVIISDI